MVMNGIASGTAHTAISIGFEIAVLVVVGSWVLLFAVLLLFYLALVIAHRGRRPSVPSSAAVPRAPAARGPRAGSLPAGMDALRRADPHFDEQLLLDAAQTALLLMFAATATGDEAPLSRVVTRSFWQTTQGRGVHTIARDRRTSNEYAASNPNGSKARQQNVPVDYQASAPELTSLRLGGAAQEICVRVAFGELVAYVRPGAAAFTAAASATSVTSSLAAMGRAVAAQASDNKQDSVSWAGVDGHYDLTFVRPAGAQTDPAAALADRTCATCGATYMSEFAVACEHCGTARPMPWGQWRLASADHAG
jgi:hypothetical protein